VDRPTKVKVAAGAGAAVVLALLIGVLGALAAAAVMDDDDDRRGFERVRAEPRMLEEFALPDLDLFARPFVRPARGVDLDEAAEYLELSESELRERLRDGDTLAEVAEEEGKSVEGLVDALVAAGRERIDEEAAEAKESLEDCVDDLVNGDFPAFGFDPGCR
jgi:hypothetical protein